MAYLTKQVTDFSKGTITSITDEKIPRGAASRTRNFRMFGDLFELSAGGPIVGAELNSALPVKALVAGRDVAGNEHLFRIYGANLDVYDEATELWVNLKNDLYLSAEFFMDTYRSPAGSFITVSSPDVGPYRINLADLGAPVDMYNGAKNFHGFYSTANNIGFTVQRPGFATVVYRSYIDDDFPYTAITNENIGTGDASAVTFTDTLANPLIAGRTITVTAGAVTGTDDGSGVISGTGITGTVNYTTGAISVTFSVAPAGALAITADYSYEKPKDHGIFDFSYSGTRTAGQGDLVLQNEGSDPIVFVWFFKGVYYVFHQRSIWALKYSDDDLSYTNLVTFRETGLANFRAAAPSDRGIFYADQANPERPVLRLLEYNEITDGTKLPKDISQALNLTGYNFDDSSCAIDGDLVVWSCMSPGATANDTLICYNMVWDLFYFEDKAVSCLVKGIGGLYAGSSVSPNVYKLNDGYSIDEVAIDGEIEFSLDDLDIEELKKNKKFVVEGEIEKLQEIEVWVAFDGGAYTRIGSVDGATDYLEGTRRTCYGSLLHGTSYGGSDPIDVYTYMKQLRFPSTKFLRAKVKFVTVGEGYVNGRMFVFKDIRKKGFKLPSQFR